MKKPYFILIAFLGAGFAVSAETSTWIRHTKSFSLKSQYLDREIYYNCGRVEQKVETFLADLGATHIGVQCTGGIDESRPTSAWDATVDVTFDSLSLNSNGASVRSEWVTKNITYRDSCDLLSQVFGEVEEAFELRDVKMDSCTSMTNDLRIQYSTLTPR